MKKNELIKEIAQKTGLTKKDINKVINATIETMKKAFKNNEKISFMGFGSFEVVTRAPRKARSPRTGKIIKVPKTKTVKFKISRKLKEFLNS